MLEPGVKVSKKTTISTDVFLSKWKPITLDFFSENVSENLFDNKKTKLLLLLFWVLLH